MRTCRLYQTDRKNELNSIIAFVNLIICSEFLETNMTNGANLFIWILAEYICVLKIL